jgi:BirA family transcriptional regulator, biotin operon repressor / biotin---[acetyl-CoA-carboxylase] ligase
MQLRGQLLRHLADGEFHSGEALGSILGVSRMAVWKHLKSLRRLGITFESVRGKGYRLIPACELLAHDRILSCLQPPAAARLAGLEILLETGSTNTRLRDQALRGAPTGAVCLAEMQTAGRGRHGRHWASPFAGNLYLSLLWRSTLGAAALGGLSLAAGIGVLRALQDAGVSGVGLKWPNDLLVRQAKLAGVLIDVIGESNGQCAVIIGVGLNVRMPPSASPSIDQPWTDLHQLLEDSLPSRNRLAASLIGQLFAVLETFEQQGLQPFRAEWEQHDVLAGNRVDLKLPQGPVHGIARGIDAGGALIIETGPGELQRFSSGEASVRVAP